MSTVMEKTVYVGHLGGLVSLFKYGSFIYYL